MDCFPTEEEVMFVALLASHGHLPKQVPARKAADLGDGWGQGWGWVLASSLPKLVSAAALATHRVTIGYFFSIL